MNENKKTYKMRLSEQLPMHSADPATWDRLSDKLDMLDAQAAYSEKLQQMPIHSPNQGMWAIINRRLTRTAYFKIGTRIAISVAAGLLLFLTVSRVEDFETKPSSVPMAAKQVKPGINPKTSNQAIQAIAKGAEIKDSKTTRTSIAKNNGIYASGTSKSVLETKPSAVSETIQMAKNPVISSDGNTDPLFNLPNTIIPVLENEIALNDATQVPEKNNLETVAENNSNRDVNKFLREILNTPIQNKETLTTKGLTANPIAPMVKSTPPDPAAASKSYFALGVGYLPENIYNGTDNSLFHNVDLTASYNKEKVRFNTSVGMAYNEEQFEINMNYDIKSPITAIGPGGNLDTVSYNSASLASDYIGSEKHQYLTYNLGIGRRLFSIGKFSTWLNAGAGFGIMLNNPDLITSTENSVKNQLNLKITDISTSKPVYNDVNVNFVTGIDFNYKFMNRLSFSFTPISRWYFKPVLSKNNQPTDELTLGFKTGIKFNF